MDAKEAFFSAIEDVLQRLPEEAIHILKDPKYQNVLENSSWELIPRLCANLTEKNRLENQEIYEASSNLLLELAKAASPEDLLFEFIEQAEKFNSHYSFVVILQATRIILLRMPLRRGIAIGWCCNTIIRYLSEIQAPDCRNLEGKEQLLLEKEAQLESLKDLYLEIVEFFKPFVKEVEVGQYTVLKKHQTVYKDTILKSLLKLFGNPLLYIHLQCGKTQSDFRNIAENILNFIVCFDVDILSFLNFVKKPEVENSIESDFTNASLGVFYYLILVEGICIEKMFCVYSNVYLLNQLLWLSLCLMNMDDFNVQWKGLSLAENALCRIGEKELVFEKANRPQCKFFAEHCTKIMIYSESKQNREKAVPIFYKFIRMFDPRGRYYMLLSVQDIVREPVFIGYLAIRTKDFVAEALVSKDIEELKYFTGKCLRDLIKKFCRLENGSETDIMRYSDQIVSSLNLLRYLIIRDSDNSTGFFDLLAYLDNNYFTPLKKGLEMSRAQYELQKRKMSEPMKSNNLEDIATVTIGGIDLPDMTCEQKIQILDGALNTFDLIDSLLSRVIECVHDHNSLL